MQWLQVQRIARARELLEGSDLAVERVAEISGLGTAANLRRHFTRAMGVPPVDYRRSYRADGTGRTGTGRTGGTGSAEPAGPAA